MNARRAAEGKEANDVTLDDDVDEKKTGEAMEPEICRATDELSLALEWQKFTHIWLHGMW